MKQPDKIRVLHVFRKMDRGGAETWIINVFRNMDRSQFQFDFLVSSLEPGAYDREIESLGGKIFRIGEPSNVLRYSVALLKVLLSGGGYDVVHSHVHHFSGWNLLLSCLSGVPLRIAHSHSAILASDNKTDLLRRIYLRTMRILIAGCANQGLAASRDAARSLFGNGWQDNPKIQVLVCGIDLSPFSSVGLTKGHRATLGIEHATLVLGHVGRFSQMKNHVFLLRVMAEVKKLESNAKLVLVGSGPLEEEITAEVRKLGLKKDVLFLGSISNVQETLASLIDVFVFPSRYEGLGLAVVEAQAAGLPCIISDILPGEVTVIERLVTRLSLDSSHRQWAEAVLQQRTRKIDRKESIEAIIASNFNLEKSIEGLMIVYRRAR